MGAKTIAITVPEELHEKMQQLKEHFNYSSIASKAIFDRITAFERFYKKLNDNKTLEEILKSSNWRAKLANPDAKQEFCELGRSLSIYYAKTGPYHEVKELEEGLRNVKGSDKEEITAIIEKKININAIFMKWGFFKTWRLAASEISDMLSGYFKVAVLKSPQPTRLINIFSIRDGFITGIIEYADFLWRK